MIRHTHWRFLLFWMVSALGIPLSMHAAPDDLPDGRDREVIEAVLLRLLADREAFLMRDKTKTMLILENRTVVGAGFIQPGQIHSYVEDAPIPNDAAADILRRNAVPGSVESRVVPLKDLKFGPLIEPAASADKLDPVEFQQKYPKARGWVVLHLPGYSADGSLALVRGFCGPSAHSVLLTALLKKENGKWTVLWHHLAWFA